jgi:hypothetical protein
MATEKSDSSLSGQENRENVEHPVAPPYKPDEDGKKDVKVQWGEMSQQSNKT